MVRSQKESHPSSLLLEQVPGQTPSFKVASSLLLLPLLLAPILLPVTLSVESLTPSMSVRIVSIVNVPSAATIVRARLTGILWSSGCICRCIARLGRWL